ncbi:DNA replication and repair protein RecO [Anseongella ginsenosidimutans]|uniref:DNA repair protein RecO n=1 Tax=Anseongella ginsenosidimutans TaxID=496056 RepID=A0A4V2UUD7_9SPHI|nr:DNA repair protein RecO [Anseongella ginsenosidimutans]QEC51204.1 DNA repair protein RecO [Anseongella ginsenosidimutans]TCS90123.1 DNA replication and repair protein RecO [Anseongella ginsenosidimutans]
MLHKTRGIVLKTTGYKNSSIIAQVFTEKFGLQSYLVNGVRRPGSRIPFNVLQPLHLLDMVVYHKSTVSLQRVKDIRNEPVFLSIPLDIAKSTVSLFLCEVLYKVLRRQSGEDTALFQYLFNSLEWLDHHEGKIANFHLLFLMGLSRYLGFFPDTRNPQDAYFDLQNGHFLQNAPLHPWYIGPSLAGLWRQLSQGSYGQLTGLKISGEERKLLLRSLLEYYALHLEGFGQVRSYEILQELFA